MERKFLRNENGVALIAALIMLLILTFIGISAISTTTFETNISGNERVGTAAFYASEAVFQYALNQLPEIKSISETEIGEDAYGWSGEPISFGIYHKAGYDSAWAFKRYQIDARGKSFSATREIEAQVSYGPFSAGTLYN